MNIPAQKLKVSAGFSFAVVREKTNYAGDAADDGNAEENRTAAGPSSGQSSRGSRDKKKTASSEDDAV